MLLTRHNVIAYLIAQNLLGPHAITGENITVIEASQRNRNFKVVHSDGPGFLVKQLSDWAENSRRALQREARLHALAAEGPLVFLQPHLPVCHRYDAHHNTLTLALVPAAESLAAHLPQPGQPLNVAMTQLGHALGHLHRRTSTPQTRATLAADFEPWLPWAMSASAHVATETNPPAAVSHLRRTLRGHPDIQQHLAQLSREWRTPCLIHNDLKGDHCLLSSKLAPTLVDWEMTTLGEPRWDVGCVFAAALLPWVALAAEQLVAPAAALLKAAQHRLRAFWEGYAAARSFPRARWPAEQIACLRYAAARLVQTAYEDAHVRHDLSPREVLLLQLSQNIFQRPDEARRHLISF